MFIELQMQNGLTLLKVSSLCFGCFAFGVRYVEEILRKTKGYIKPLIHHVGPHQGKD